MPSIRPAGRITAMELHTFISQFLPHTTAATSGDLFFYPVSLLATQAVARGRRPIRGVWARLRPAPVRAFNRRRYRRFRTEYLGALYPAGENLSDNVCDVLDLSLGGARIRPVEPMGKMERVILELDRVGRFPARIAWHRDGEVGLQFDEGPPQILRSMRGLLPLPLATM